MLKYACPLTRAFGSRQPSFSFRRSSNARRIHTTKGTGLSGPSSSSIFSSSESAWDHVFNDIDAMPPLVPARNARRRTNIKETNSTETRSKRQAMTAREISAFDEMFNMIFNAVSEQKMASNARGPDDGTLADVGVGRGPQMSDLFGKLRKHSRKMKWTSDSDELFDRKKEEMDLCDTDQQLLDWAMREIFGESKRYEEAARQAIAEAAAGKMPETMPVLQPETYPHLLAYLMRTFRDKYHDPHLALSMFDHARHLSIPSYVFGCSTPAYNELIQTRWTCFRDLKGVYDALEEMTVNGVDPDGRTRRLVESLRREVGERNLWAEENELGGGEVWAMLAKIEALILRDNPAESGRNAAFQPSDNRKPAMKHWDSWKKAALNGQSDDEWEFGRWADTQPQSTESRRQDRRASENRLYFE